MEDVWVVAPGDAAGRIRLTLRTGPPRPLAATLTEAELASVADVLPQVAEAVRRGEFSRIRLGTAFRNAIGRDPFRQATGSPPRKGMFAWWLDVAYVVVGLTFAAGNSNPWLRLAGWSFAAIAAGDLAGHAWRRRRRRT
ncbi:hypothetical protein [Actinoplanes sp. NPDC026623]|uniref:hypothetical protein n=1 Tax=Actinoplanes sp. NPDC026623 TaxID=3155610 RepID=UPI0033D98982